MGVCGIACKEGTEIVSNIVYENIIIPFTDSALGTGLRDTALSLGCQLPPFVYKWQVAVVQDTLTTSRNIGTSGYTDA